VTPDKKKNRNNREDKAILQMPLQLPPDPGDDITLGSADAFDETENPRDESERELSDEQLDEELSED